MATINKKFIIVPSLVIAALFIIYFSKNDFGINKDDPKKVITPPNEYELLDGMARAGGTDKRGEAHNYTAVYYRYFGPIRHKKLKFMEIGVYQGASVKMWEAYFPNAELHFVDVTDQNLLYRSNRSHFHFFDQKNPQKLREFSTEVGGQFDIIIDDGGHQSNQVLIAFKALFPLVKENGGIYVIEDLHAAYWNGFGGTGILGNISVPATPLPGSTMHFLKNLLDEVNFVGAYTAIASGAGLTAELRQKMSEYAKHIESIHFYSSLCIIVKK